MDKKLEIYTYHGLVLNLMLFLCSRGKPFLSVKTAVGISLGAAVENVTLVTYQSLPDLAFLEIPGCCIAIESEFVADVEAFLGELRLIKY